MWDILSGVCGCIIAHQGGTILAWWPALRVSCVHLCTSATGITSNADVDLFYFSSFPPEKARLKMAFVAHQFCQCAWA